MGLSNSPNQTVTSVGVVRNRIGTAAVFAVQRHLANMFRQKRLQTTDARAKFVSEQFKSDDDHPFIWRQYVVGDIENHPEIGGYQTVRRLSRHLHHFLTVFVDTSWCLSVRTHFGNTARLLLFIWNHGIPTARRPRRRKPSRWCTCHGHCCCTLPRARHMLEFLSPQD